MLITASQFRDFTIQAKDGELGTITGFYFEDQTWAVRYLLLETGHWLNERTVLISPFLRCRCRLGDKASRAIFDQSADREESRDRY